MQKKALNNLIENVVLIHHIENEDLRVGSEDYEVILKKQHLTKAMQDFINDKISKKGLEDWAELIEGRDSVEYEEKYRDKISNVLFLISTPEINKSINKKNINEYIKYLSD